MITPKKFKPDNPPSQYQPAAGTVGGLQWDARQRPGRGRRTIWRWAYPNVDVYGRLPTNHFSGVFCGNVWRSRPSIFGSRRERAKQLSGRSQYAPDLRRSPKAGTEKTTTRIPTRCKSRNLFDCAWHDNLFHGARYKWSLRFTVIKPGQQNRVYNFCQHSAARHYVDATLRNANRLPPFVVRLRRGPCRATTVPGQGALLL